MLGLFNRTLFLELVRVFALGLAGMTGIFVFFGVVQTASQNGLSFAQIVAIVPLVVPMSWPYTIPATTLFASCVVYGRLSNDNEAVALKAAGVDLYTLLRPALLLGLLTTVLTGVLLHTVVPLSLQRQEAEFLRDPEEMMYNLLKKDRTLRSSSDPKKPSYSLYVRDVQNRVLKDVVVKRRPAATPDPVTGAPRIEYEFIARSPSATLRVDLEAGLLIVDMPQMAVWGDRSKVESNGSPPVEIELPEQFTGKGVRTRPQGVVWDELPARRAVLAEKRAERERELADSRRLAGDPATPPATADLARLQEPIFAKELKELDRQLRTYEYEYQARPALAVGCLAFAVIGCPVGLWFSRSDYLSTFVICWLPSMLVYYPLTVAVGGLARDGKLPMLVGVWAANVILGAGAAVLAWRLIKR